MKNTLLLITICFYSFKVVAQTQIKVLTYSIHHGENMKAVLDLQGIANVILATNPDLAALQEVDSGTFRSNKSDQLKELAAITGMYTYFAKSINVEGGSCGTGILSRFPITGNVTLSLPVAKGEKPKAAGIVTVKLPGDTLIQFASIRLDSGSNATMRIAQVSTLKKYFKQSTIPVIIAGDFNATPESKEIAIMKTLFTDATSQAGHTFPADAPKVKQDYVMVHPKHHWIINSVNIIPETVASDHRPLICNLEMK